jgi:aspartate aminotransferase
MASSAEQWLWQSRIAPELLEVAAAGEIDLSTGSPSFAVPSQVREAIIRKVRETEHLPYPPTAGAGNLQKGIADYLRAWQELSFEPAHVLVAYGAMQALYDIVSAVASPGDDVLLPAPCWFQYPHIVRNCGATPRLIPTFPGNNFKLTPKLLSASITPATKLLIFTTPNNPSGALYSRDELAALARVIAGNPGLLVISNGVYDLLLLGAAGAAGGKQLPVAPTLASFPEIAGRVFVVNSLSKNYAMSGLRVGYVAIADAYWLGRMTQRQRFSSLGVNVYLQEGALAAIGATDEVVGGIVDTLRRRLPGALDRLRGVPRFTFIPPQAGYYVWVDVRAYYGCVTPEQKVIRDDTDLAFYLRQDMAGIDRVAVVDGTSCGTPGYFRITFAVDEETFDRGVRAILQRIAALRCE